MAERNGTSTTTAGPLPDTRVVVAFHKPKPMVADLTKERGMLRVAERLHREVGTRLTPVGRLDRTTTGLLIWTNDGGLTTELNATAEKEYRVMYMGVEPGTSGVAPLGELTVADLAALLGGVLLEKEGKHVRFETVTPRPDLAERLPPVPTKARRAAATDAAPAEETAEIEEGTDEPPVAVVKTRHFVDVTLRCGVYHVVKRAFHHCTGRAVSGLHRTRVNGLRLADVNAPSPGSYCVLTPTQIEQLTTRVP